MDADQELQQQGNQHREPHELTWEVLLQKTARARFHLGAMHLHALARQGGFKIIVVEDQTVDEEETLELHQFCTGGTAPE